MTRSGPGRSWEQLRWADGAVARVTADVLEKKSLFFFFFFLSRYKTLTEPANRKRFGL